MTKHHLLSESVGWTGVVLVLASYALLSLGVINGDSATYHGLVLVGSLGVAVVSVLKRTFQPAVLNITFAVLAILALIRLSFA